MVSKVACTIFRLYQVGADEIVRETSDYAVCGSKLVLEFLGIPREQAEQVFCSSA